jgi:hypothetical protein
LVQSIPICRLQSAGSVLFSLLFCATLHLNCADRFARAQDSQLLQSYIYQGKTFDQFCTDLSASTGATLATLGSIVEMDAQQLSLLKLACEGDVARLMQEITRIAEQTKDVDMNNIQPERWNDIWDLIMPARQKVELGLHGQGSLFEKSMLTVLQPEQARIYHDHLRKSEVEFLTATFKLTLFELESILPLTSSQRTAIVELVDQSMLPRKVQLGMAQLSGLVVFAKLPRDKVSEILNEDQMKTFNRLRKHAQGFVGSFKW